MGRTMNKITLVRKPSRKNKSNEKDRNTNELILKELKYLNAQLKGVR